MAVDLEVIYHDAFLFDKRKFWRVHKRRLAMEPDHHACIFHATDSAESHESRKDDFRNKSNVEVYTRNFTRMSHGTWPSLLTTIVLGTSRFVLDRDVRFSV